MTGRRLTTGLTLVVLVVVLCVMAVWGWRAMTSPIEDTPSAANTGPDCPTEDQTVITHVKRSEITVSVYNAGKRSGRAQATMELLERAGFRAGEVNNAPEGVDVRRAAVLSTDPDDPEAKLVALAFGPNTEIVRSDDELGPGVDVVIGDRFNKLDPKAPKRVKLDEPETICK